MSKFSSKCLAWIFCAVLVSWSEISAGQLSENFYQNSCPKLENILSQVNQQKFKESPVVAAGTLRLFFHDCMVEGCDASVMIVSSASNKAEKDADVNLSLPGDAFDAVVRGKQAAEAQCPGVVSCADILAIATRDFVGMIGGPFWKVKKGKRDGLISQAARVNGNLPNVNDSVDKLASLFASKGLSMDEMVTLEGAHTAGFAHCNEFMNRIYNFSSTSQSDPTMKASYAASLRQACPQQNLDPTVVAFLDVTTPRAFDNVFYQNVQNGLGLLQSDQVLYSDARTKPTVDSFAGNQKAFFNAFVIAMDHLGSVGVKTGSQGEIRKDCAAFNS
ncbi:hypothetical protein O6H91_03G009000 [Diphasiastrum complanatum]|uniref:Uncharacterized protein n=2 Tax=Diphasiastrum complanatum TaxID=34168 RepID=A0ACC2E390_DIPCM|nr:hypothetical protein O6H91_03G002600 [Diphasiastrum complanatum]KAJ7560986.1 hypothetical protein O6H91_03G009000 [Diphasiastrum complanatum]